MRTRVRLRIAYRPVRQSIADSAGPRRTAPKTKKLRDASRFPSSSERPTTLSGPAVAAAARGTVRRQMTPKVRPVTQAVMSRYRPVTR
jgi:hypothetical protein